MFLWLCLLGLWFTTVNIAAAGATPLAKDSNETCQVSYPLEDRKLESQGIYTGRRDPDKLLVFEVSEKSVLTVDSLSGSNETIVVRRTMTIRDECPMVEQALSPTLTELFKETGEVCFTGPSQGTRDISDCYSLPDRMFMAVWTFLVPAKQCFSIKFLIRQLVQEYYFYIDKLTILRGEMTLQVAIKSGVSQYELPPQNKTTTVSVVYFFTTLRQRAFWKMAPSLKTSDCLC